MLISEASKIANLTKKAIEYYTEQKLVLPVMLNNGYRDFSENDVERLKRISVFRKLGLNTEEIKAVLADQTNNTLQKISVQKDLNMQKEQVKKSILDKLSCDQSYAEINADLKAIEQSATVTEKLLEAFPGYYGRFICLHFARFLNESITTTEQESAYAEIITFLDNVPSLNFSEELQSFLIESTKHISIENIRDMIEKTKQSIENPDKFLSENKEVLEQYLAYKQSEEFKNSPVFKIQTMLKEFNSTSDYYNVFIPAMKKLSVSYAEYHEQMEIANERLLSQYPDIAKLNN
ncbi:MerR family transcriptional regulator [Clostridium saccharoperbutylacetonicum]|uniref:MerR family transcriptional regulator n=1 Tax=Clostridium saccharoperbutylacetonicum TaxID=36745 RepID=UPI000983E05A|nr:MerR family transcriptional regulator [Clostridium saccharoperbutylacetonicum]AQR95646.1 HTH-type transcriptional regulator HmrR [Clostridium saccharoperbutylacetonicum]NSB31509.1 DNA-binding transcriptional MerR regulator [Clostridium saccharoperbutylacetonicum]